jgi:hypothetical protein
LLVDNVGFFTYAASKKLGVLKGGGVNTLIAIELADINHLLFQVAPVGLLLG